MDTIEVQFFTLEELKEIQLGTLIPAAIKMGIPESAGAKRDTIIGMVFVAQNDNPEVVADMREHLQDIAERHRTVSQGGNAPDPKVPRQRSAVGGAVQKVWDIAEKMKTSPRKEVIGACVAAGININTAKTQYAKWKGQQKG